jgi:type I restriction enzyme M protein
MGETVEHRRQEVQQIVKNACNQLNAEGIAPRDYVEQLAWLFFLKAFDEREARTEDEGEFEGTQYQRRLSGDFAWGSWARNTDHPDEMLEFVNGKLWTKLTSPDPKIGLGDDLVAQRFRRIFENVRNHCRRGISFARVVQQVDRLHFSDDTDVHVLSELYEDLLKRVASDGAGYAGEFYTQRHIIRAMVEVVKPKPGDRVYDPCFGTAGFLAESANYIRKHNRLSGRQLEKVQRETFFGLEYKPLTYLLGTMNMILHGIEGANLELDNTLERHTENVAEKDKYDVILSNPPYGGKMEQSLQSNFRMRSAATECLFLQHMMATLAKGGRAAVVIPEGVLFRGGPDQRVREELLRKFELHTVLSLPPGCFLPYTPVKTNVMYFNRPEVDPGESIKATKKVWFYELTNDGFELRQTRKPIDGDQIPDFLARREESGDGLNSWSLSVDEIEDGGWDLSARNPNRGPEPGPRPARELIQSIKTREERVLSLLSELEEAIEQ